MNEPVALVEIPERKTFLGGSDSAAIMGLSPYKTPLRLYMEKRGNYAPTQEDRIRERMMARGKREEPHIVDDLAKLHGVQVVKRSYPKAPNYYADPELPYLAAEIDFEWLVTREIREHFLDQSGFEIPEELIGTIQNGEVKTMHPFAAAKKIGDEGTDEFPIEYFTQVQHGLGIMSRQLTLVAFGVYCNDPLIYFSLRDEDAIAKLREAEIEFWGRLQGEAPPDPKNNPDIALLFGQKKKGTKKEATPEIAQWARDLERHRRLEEVHKEAAEEAKFEIGRFLLGAVDLEDPKADPAKHFLTFGGEAILSVGRESRTSIDADLLRAKFPEAAKACGRTSSHYTYRKTKKGTKI